MHLTVTGAQALAQALEGFGNDAALRVAKMGRGWAFTPHDFADLGDPRAVGVTLGRLVRDGKIRRISCGIYDSPHDHPLLGRTGASGWTASGSSAPTFIHAWTCGLHRGRATMAYPNGTR